MTALTPDQIAQKWANNLSASGPTIQAGVAAVRTAPGQLAAAQQNAYVANVQASAGKWATNVAKVTLPAWQNAMTTKGLPRIATGAQAAQSNFALFMGKLIPFEASLVASLPARGTVDQNINRAVAFMQGMRNFTA